jgi:predicted transport protein
MSLYQIQNQKVNSIKEKDFLKEKEIHDLIETNLEELFGLQLIDGEFEIEGYYLDSLAFDVNVNSFVIIEYKRDKNNSIVDQGLHYMQLLLTHKADFVLAYNHKFNKNLQVKNFDWGQIRVMFIARSFTAYQQGATNFQDFPIELWEATRYQKDLLNLNQIKSNKKAESITKLVKNSTTVQITKEIKTYTLEDHLAKGDEWTKELFFKLQREIFELDDRVQEKPVINYIGYKIRYQNFCSVHFFKDKIRIEVRCPRIDDPKNVFKKYPDSYLWGKTPLWYWDIKNEKDIDYAIPIIRQGYEAAPDK